MTFSEFYAALARLAGSRAFSARVTASNGSNLVWEAWVTQHGWTDECLTPEEALAQMGTLSRPLSDVDAERVA